MSEYWTPIECKWMPLSHYGTWLTMVWPWERSHLCQNWTHPEHLWVHVNSFEWLLNTHWMLVSACECQWVSIEHPLNTQWMCMNANEWVGTAPEHPLNVHEYLWVSIWKVWMRTYRVVNSTNLSGWFKLRVWTLTSIKILCFRSKNMHTFLAPWPRYVWYFHTSTVTSTCKKIACRDGKNMMYKAIYFKGSILTLLSSWYPEIKSLLALLRSILLPKIRFSAKFQDPGTHD
jgi:hypothetical protein